MGHIPLQIFPPIIAILVKWASIPASRTTCPSKKAYTSGPIYSSGLSSSVPLRNSTSKPSPISSIHVKYQSHRTAENRPRRSLLGHWICHPPPWPFVVHDSISTTVRSRQDQRSIFHREIVRVNKTQNHPLFLLGRSSPPALWELRFGRRRCRNKLRARFLRAPRDLLAPPFNSMLKKVGSFLSGHPFFFWAVFGAHLALESRSIVEFLIL